MIRFAQTSEAIAATPAKLEKVEHLAGYLRSLEDADLQAAARFFTGNPFAARDSRSLALGGRTVLAAAKNVWKLDDGALRAAYRDTGDFGAALGALVHPATDLGLFPEALTPSALAAIFDRIADARGKNAGKTRQALCERIFRACTDPLEVTYVVKIITGDLRIGLREGLVLDAIAAAFQTEPARVRRATMAAGDVGHVAVAARAGRLDEIHVAYGAPIGFMLATPIPFGEAYGDVADDAWIAEDKYDGIRAQAHAHGADVRIFSRTLNDVTHSYPEVAASLRALQTDAILDGEIVAKRDGRVLPFRYLQARLQRKDPSEELLREVPLVFVAFDALAIGDAFLIDEPLVARRERLRDVIQTSKALELAPFSRVDGSGEEINALFESARERGNEGLMLKRTDAPYHPGRRGKWWLKLKRELETLDVVVVAVEWGHGKRAKVISDYTFAVRASLDKLGTGSGELLTIGKAYSGLTDAEIAQLTPWFLAHVLRQAQDDKVRRHGHAMSVEPQIVLEVAFDIIQKSTLHESGYALRFPRIVRIRDDKPPEEIDTIDRVEEIYRQMLEREQVER
jgi:ATP-dependent DNA ligase